ncbi:hypothetical protein [Parapedobacter sp. DT-150]|uniref:hypothetical protein n=1 Tax=Parapedobacter sp. DT-150 TaxID=3396162 RepID=UPI003F1AC655
MHTAASQGGILRCTEVPCGHLKRAAYRIPWEQVAGSERHSLRRKQSAARHAKDDFQAEHYERRQTDKRRAG